MTTETKTKEAVIEEAEALLAGVEHKLPVRVDFITGRDTDEGSIAVVRKNDGYLFVGPHPESDSALQGDRATLEFIGSAPRLMRSLLDLLVEKG
jgi:hypothetical protein